MPGQRLETAIRRMRTTKKCDALMTWASPVQKGRRLLNWDVDNITCLLLLPEGQQTDTRHLDDLEPDTRDITLGLTPATEAGDQDLVVLIDEVQATIVLWRPILFNESGRKC